MTDYTLPMQAPSAELSAQALFARNGLDWNVRKLPLAAVDSPPAVEGEPQQWPTMVACKPHVGIVTDEQPARVLGVHKDSYQTFQNLELATLTDELAARGIVGKPSDAFALRGGRVVLVQCAAQGFTIGDNDRTESSVLLGLSHDGSLPLFALVLHFRLWCSNQLTSALRDGAPLAKVRHTRNMRDRLEAAKDAVYRAQGFAETFRTSALELARQRITTWDALRYWREVYQTMSPEPTGQHSADDAERKRWQRWDDKRTGIVRKWREVYDRECDELADVGGSLWLAFNAVTNWSDHDRIVRVHKGTDRAEAERFTNVLGTGAAFKQRALTIANKCAESMR